MLEVVWVRLPGLSRLKGFLGGFGVAVEGVAVGVDELDGVLQFCNERRLSALLSPSTGWKKHYPSSYVRSPLFDRTSTTVKNRLDAVVRLPELGDKLAKGRLAESKAVNEISAKPLLSDGNDAKRAM